MLIARLLKVATPFTALTEEVPLSTAPAAPVLAVMAMLTAPLNPVTVFPCASRTVTATAGEMAEPATTFDGWVLKARLVGVPAVMAKVELAALVRPELLATSV